MGPDFGIQELVGFGEEALNKVLKPFLQFDNGYPILTDAPGLGVSSDETAAEKQPYKRSYFLVSGLGPYEIGKEK